MARVIGASFQLAPGQSLCNAASVEAFNLQELWLERSHQPKLRYALVAPPTNAGGTRGAVFVTQGFSEHIDRYSETAREWARAGYAVAIHDLRGQGRSEGRRGHVCRFDDYVDDALAVLDALESDVTWRRGGPPILFGHSLGALISCHVALRYSARFSGIALCSPYFGRALKVSALRIWAGRAASPIWPMYSARVGISVAKLTHDVERASAINADPLNVHRITARWFVEVETAQARLETAASTLELPIFCQAAGADAVADVEATKRLMSQFASKHKELRVREQEFHELLQEVRRREYRASFAAWFDAVTKQALPVGPEA